MTVIFMIERRGERESPHGAKARKTQRQRVELHSLKAREPAAEGGKTGSLLEPSEAAQPC